MTIYRRKIEIIDAHNTGCYHFSNYGNFCMYFVNLFFSFRHIPTAKIQLSIKEKLKVEKKEKKKKVQSTYLSSLVSCFKTSEPPCELKVRENNDSM